ncbi:MAG TPA: hypothetical protein EYQ42_08710 [Thiotrichaceae bacterium]|jgi:hypothetical protein|nr:hypothetical protein [Thiotrichaceae bacterium]HIM07366.1 hypothetical protein [Gammaproteobacteria bacterium]
MNPSVLIAAFLTFANKLKFKNLFLITITLFVTDLIIPDFIPLIDEIILGLLAIILANWKDERKNENKGNLIEGEVINEKEQDKDQ